MDKKPKFQVINKIIRKLFKSTLVAIILIITTLYVGYSFYKYENYDTYLSTVKNEINSAPTNISDKTLAYISCSIEPNMEDSFLGEFFYQLLKSLISQENLSSYRHISEPISKYFVRSLHGSSISGWHLKNMLFLNNLSSDFDSKALTNFFLNTFYNGKNKLFATKILEIESKQNPNIEDEILRYLVLAFQHKPFTSEEKFQSKLNEFKSKIPEDCRY